MRQEVIRAMCKELRLGTHIGEIYPSITADDFEEFLEKLLIEAIRHRAKERQKRLIRQARFDLMKGFDTFDFTDVVLPPDVTEETLASCEFVHNQQNLILYGRPGTGKTHLAIALGLEACKRDLNVMYFKTSRLVNLLAKAKEEGKEERFWKKLDKVDLLILDEWGYIPFERVGTQMLFEAVSACYEKRSVIITTNLPFDEWNTIFYDQKLTSAILDRLVHHGLLVRHDGQSYRVRHSLMQ